MDRTRRLAGAAAHDHFEAGMFLGRGQWQVVGSMSFGGLDVDSKNIRFGCRYSWNRERTPLDK